MIVSHNLVLLGRKEEVTDTADRIAVDIASRAMQSIYQLFLDQVNERKGRWHGNRKRSDKDALSDEERFWNDWQVLAMAGGWGRWNVFCMMHIEEFGVHPAPAITEQWMYYPARNILTKMPCSAGNQAVVVHQTTKLLNTSDWPIRGVKKSFAERAYEGLLSGEKVLEDLMAHTRPDGQTVGGLKKILSDNHMHLELPPVKGGAHGKFRTYQVVRDKLPSEVHLEGIDGDLAIPKEQMMFGKWKSLDEAIREKV